MRRIERISGRSDDMLIIRGVNVFPSQIETQILKVPGLTPHFQLIVDQAQNMKSLTIQVEPDPGSPVDRSELSDTLQAHVKDNVGVNATVNIVEVGEIPRSQGKAARVLDLTRDA